MELFGVVLGMKHVPKVPKHALNVTSRDKLMMGTPTTMGTRLGNADLKLALHSKSTTLFLLFSNTKISKIALELASYNEELDDIGSESNLIISCGEIKLLYKAGEGR